ncbi:MAG: MgtC/SapB family protein [Ruminococcaceae bacterium]|nr:MgtC/SapB family protein [Oscillospiraceae bacterium]MBR3595371.1 MgtC/SapB family protein [Clostridia bacterium]
MTEIIEFFNGYSDAVLVIRIILAGICGGIIGVERTLRQKDAGFRTHIIVAMGAALMVIISKYGFLDIVFLDSVQVDVSRVASNIITGISFLGAGMIFVKGISIKGLTTAAGIWVTAAVGMAMGAGLYIVALISVFLLLLVQIVFHKFLIGFDKVLANDNLVPCFVQIENTPVAVKELKAFLKANGVQVFDSSIETSQSNEKLTIHLNVQYEKDVDIDDVFERYLQKDGVYQAFSI